MGFLLGWLTSAAASYWADLMAWLFSAAASYWADLMASTCLFPIIIYSNMIAA